ncbi:undecaprenyl diphosphate synthase family protein [Streptomyces virginiae]|uniref:undecaprenyl diphosphate synthase family protein n=1 Tax=Streptomyces virginiae TaxID=1961 RepID=UPI00372098F6
MGASPGRTPLSVGRRGTTGPSRPAATSGEQRLSGFMPWQSAYSELYFCDVQ